MSVGQYNIIDDDVIIEGERINLDWVEKLVISAKECLDMESSPSSGEFCEHCAYVDAASKI